MLDAVSLSMVSGGVKQRRKRIIEIVARSSLFYHRADDIIIKQRKDLGVDNIQELRGVYTSVTRWVIVLDTSQRHYQTLPPLILVGWLVDRLILNSQ